MFFGFEIERIVPLMKSNFDGESSATTKRKIEAKSLREPPEKDLDPEIGDYD